MKLERNLAAVMTGINQIKIEEREIPKPDKGQIVCAIHSVGVCGTDIHHFKTGKLGDLHDFEVPLVLGHEASATVVSVGEGCTKFKVGDRVVLEPGVPCKMCHPCKIGRYNLCQDVKCHSHSPVDGTFQRYIAHDEDFTFKLPDNLTMEEGALVEPFACCLWACQRADIMPGDSVLICGAGSVGMLMIQAAKAFGAGRIVCTDIKPHRLAFAKTFGADYTVLASNDVKSVANQITSLLGDGPNVSIDCTGVDSSIKLAMEATKMMGVVMLTGIGRGGDVHVPLQRTALMKEVDIRGSNKFVGNIPQAIRLMETGVVNLKAMVSHSFKLEETLKALNTAAEAAEGTLKVLVRCTSD